MATLSTYTASVQNEVDDTSARAQAVIEQGIKDTYQEIVKHCGRFLLGTDTYSTTATSGNQEYTPTAFLDIVAALWRDAGQTSFSVLKQISEEVAIQRFYNASRGTPTMFYPAGNSLILVVTPNNAGTLEVVYVPVTAELAGSVTSVIPDRYTNVVLLGGIARFKMYEAVPEAVDYQAKYAASLQDMKKELGARFEIIQPSFMGR